MRAPFWGAFFRRRGMSEQVEQFEEKTFDVTIEQAEETPAKKGRVKEILKTHFTAVRMAYMAIFTALAVAVTFLEFPIFPAAPFLKLDFANLFFMIEGFIFGPVEAIVSIGIKELLCLTKSSSAGVGELANFIMSTAYILLPAALYRLKKGRGFVVLYLAIACAVQVGVGLLVNRYINFPFYGALMNFNGEEMFYELWYFVLFFNLIKSVAVGLAVFLIYKPLSRFIKKTSEKFSRKKKA